MSRLAVVAVGGNSLITDSEHESIPDQFDAVTETSRHIIDMIEEGWNIVVTHGNGPQVGFILRRSEMAAPEVSPVPMDYAGADIQGAVGYMFQKALHNELSTRGIDRQVATIVTQTLVDRSDPSFDDPSKPIGSYMEEKLALAQAEKNHWSVIEDAGRGWRRVVPSPLPLRIIELQAIRALQDSGFIVICCGGGGIPVVEDENATLKGVEAVIDKDLASSVLAHDLGADTFVVATAVERVAINFNKPDQRWLDTVTVLEAEEYLAAGHFLKGSMEPKIKAIVGFLRSGGNAGLVTDPPNLGRALRGDTGTRFTR